MRQLLGVLLVVGALSGCASAPQIHYVSVPPPVIVIPAEPVWVTTTVTKDMTIGEIARIYKAFKVQALGYIKELKAVIPQ